MRDKIQIPTELFEEMIVKNGQARIKVQGSSMLPFIREGTRMLVKRYSKIRVGDLVCFKHRDRFWIHRLVEIRSSAEGLRFRTKGDHNRRFDPWLTGNQIMGKATRMEGRSLNTFFWRWANFLIAMISYGEGKLLEGRGK